MLAAVLLLQLTAIASATPFHKYPYVFLLDVGNEELEKVNTEQIRISKQGGSLALRYPAVGNGEDIAHVRVSGIDFGTDLKANIVDGGPGYKYVVLVLTGNPGVSFDAVITVQTVPDQNNDIEGIQNMENDSRNAGYQEPGDNDPNDSAEDLSDSDESGEASQISIMKENAELTQESSNVYNYAVNEALSGYGNNVHSNENKQDEESASYDSNYSHNDDDANEKYSDQKDIHIPSRGYKIQVEEDNALQFEDYTNDEKSESGFESPPQEAQYINNDYPSKDDDQSYTYYGNQEEINTGLYQAFKQNLYNDGAYSQVDDSGTVFIEEPGDNDGTLNLEDMIGEEYDENDNNKYYGKTNNYFIDRSDGSAVAY